jgi:hypothetical protein
MAFRYMLEYLKIACLLLMIALPTALIFRTCQLQKEAAQVLEELRSLQEPPWLLPTVRLDEGKEQCDGL